MNLSKEDAERADQALQEAWKQLETKDGTAPNAHVTGTLCWWQWLAILDAAQRAILEANSDPNKLQQDR